MVRLQIQLEPRQHRLIRRRARQLGVSVSEMIRRCVDAEVRRVEDDEPGIRARKAMAAAGRYEDPAGARRVAAEHDVALADAYER